MSKNDLPINDESKRDRQLLFSTHENVRKDMKLTSDADEKEGPILKKLREKYEQSKAKKKVQL